MSVLSGIRHFYVGGSAAGRGRQLRALRVWGTLVVAGYLLLVVTGVTTSSIGIGGLLDDPAEPAPGLIVGHADAIRSDEFLRSSPWRIGQIVSAGGELPTPLTYPDTTLVTAGLRGGFTSAIYPDVRVLSVGGETLAAQRFAASWWIPVALVIGLIPVWLAQLGVGPRIGIPTALLLVLSPVAIWWSWGAISVLAWAVLAAVLLGVAVTRARTRWGTAVSALAVVGAAIALARLGLSYLLWAVPLGMGILLPTAASLLARPGLRRRALMVAAATIAITAVVFLGFLREHSESLQVLSSTVYPGTRRFAGQVQSLPALFGAPHLWILQRDPVLTATNQSEIASGYLILAVAALLIVPSIHWRKVGIVAVPALTSLLVVGLLALWCSATWPAWVGGIPVVGLVSPARVAQVLGLLGTTTFALVIGAFAVSKEGGRRGAAVTAGAVSFLVTLMAGSLLQTSFIAGLPLRWIWVVSVLTGLAVGLAIGFARRWWGLVPLVVLAVPVVVTVNPWQQGFAELHSGKAAEELDRLSAGPGIWASEDIWVDAVLMANAHQSLSGQQWIGPNRESWEVLDPESASEALWNRGASFVVFRWAASGKPVTIEAPTPDYLLVTADPCDTKLRVLGVTRIVSQHALKHQCLTPTSSFALGGATRWTYAIKP